MSKVTIAGNPSGTGTFTIASPNSNTDRTLTLPDNTGTILTTATPGVPVNGPAFSAYAGGSNQTIANNTATKIQYNTEFWDTASCYDTTNYRFTPNVAGYYQISCRWNAATSAAVAGELFVYLYKNGSPYKRITNDSQPLISVGIAVQGSCMVYLNGTTDYIETFVYQSTGSNLNSNYFSAEGSWFDGFLARSA